MQKFKAKTKRQLNERGKKTTANKQSKLILSKSSNSALLHLIKLVFY